MKTTKTTANATKSAIAAVALLSASQMLRADDGMIHQRLLNNPFRIVWYQDNVVNTNHLGVGMMMQGVPANTVVLATGITDVGKEIDVGLTKSASGNISLYYTSDGTQKPIQMQVGASDKVAIGVIIHTGGTNDFILASAEDYTTGVLMTNAVPTDGATTFVGSNDPKNKLFSNWTATTFEAESAQLPAQKAAQPPVTHSFGQQPIATVAEPKVVMATPAQANQALLGGGIVATEQESQEQEQYNNNNFGYRSAPQPRVANISTVGGNMIRKARQ